MSARPYYRDCLIEIQKKLVEGTASQLKQELIYLDALIQKNNEDPKTKLPQILSEKFNTLFHQSITPLEYVCIYNLNEKATVLFEFFPPDPTQLFNLSELM